MFFGPDRRLRAGWAVALYWTTLVVGVVGFGGLASQVVAESPPFTSRTALVVGAWTAALAGVVATWVAVQWDRRSWAYAGIGPGVGRDAVVGLAEGGVVAMLAAAVCWGGGVRWAVAGGSAGAATTGVLWLLVFFLGAALFEELAFRGYPLRRAMLGWSPGVGVVGSSGIFAAVHLGNPGITALGIVNIVLAGVWFGVAFWRSGSLARVVGLHLGWNWMFAVFGFGVSGLAFEGGVVDVVDTGHHWVTGGAFGPEGGVAGTAVLALTIGRSLWGSSDRARAT